MALHFNGKAKNIIALVKWFDSVRNENIPLNGLVLVKQACKIEGQLNIFDWYKLGIII